MTGRKSHGSLLPKIPKLWALSALALLPNSGCTRKVSLLDNTDQPGVIKGVPIHSCSRGGLCQELTEDVNKLDLLFVIDNSQGMERTQRDLLDKLPAFVDALANGHRLKDESSRFPAALDMHVGVVTTDMGVPGVEHIEGCSSDGGDDGRLQDTPRGTDCDAAYPPFLYYSSRSATSDSGVLAKDLSCITPVGTKGCDYVQPLEAALKAVMPAKWEYMGQTYETMFLSTTQEGSLGRGDQIGGARGFVREDAVLAIVVMTNDDDTSMKDTDAFRPAAELPHDSPLREQDPKLRAYSNPDSLTSLQRYLVGLRDLNLAHSERVIFGAIAGVPSDLLNTDSLDYKNDKQLADYYDAILADERMTLQVDSSANPGALVASCNHAGEPANPPRRLVELAREFGPSGVIQSLCQDDLTQAYAPIVDRIASQLGQICLEQPLPRRADGTVACDVIWELDNKDYVDPAQPPYECSDREFLKPSTKPRHDRDGNNCNVRQLVAKDADHLPSGEGFYYDDFTPSPENNCRDGRTARIRFTPGVVPTGVLRVVLDCSKN